MINQTNINHGIFALCVQVMLFPLFWFTVDLVSADKLALVLSVAGVVAVAAFVGREYGQVERKFVNRVNAQSTAAFGAGNFKPQTLSNTYPWHVFAPNLWTLDHYMDILLTFVVFIAPALIVAL